MYAQLGLLALINYMKKTLHLTFGHTLSCFIIIMIITEHPTITPGSNPYNDPKDKMLWAMVLV